MDAQQICALSGERLDQQLLAKAFAKLPERWHEPVAKNYTHNYRKKGRKAANLAVLDTLESVEGFRFGVAAGEDELRSFSKARADECFRAASRWLDADLALAAMIEIATRYGIEAPAGRHITKSGQRARLLDVQWWRRQARKVAGRNVEAAAISVGLVHRRAGLYASNETVSRRRSQKAKNRKLLESIKAINDLKQEFTLQELSDKGVSNPEIRRMELMTRLAGFDQIAIAQGHAAEFFTLTTPSRFHARDSASGRRNPKFTKEITPREAQQYQVKLFSRLRTALGKRGIKVYGFRVAEPHHDGTPHWHMVVFMEQRHVKIVRLLFQEYALGIIRAKWAYTKSKGWIVKPGTGVCWLAADGGESGAAKRRFVAETIDRSKGSAVAYIAKYIAKNVDGHNVGADYEAEGPLFETPENSAVTSAQRVDAWASCWGVRQFQQIGGAPVQVWRELRRMEANSMEAGRLRQMVEAADRGDWGAYNELNGGVMAARKDRPVMAWRVGALDTETGEITVNKYGEIAGASIAGLVSLESGEVRTRLRTWVFQRQGEALPPWSSVNNCSGKMTREQIMEERRLNYAKNADDSSSIRVDGSRFWRGEGVGHDGDSGEGFKNGGRCAAGDGYAGGDDDTKAGAGGNVSHCAHA